MFQVHDIYFLQKFVRGHNPNAKKGHNEYGIYFGTSFENVILMQHTGLKDKNGKEIYEEDIIKGITEEGEEEIITIKWDEKRACFDPFSVDFNDNWDYLYYPNKFEVIGNIYENPDLL